LIQFPPDGSEVIDMDVDAGLVLPGVAIFLASLGLTAVSLWIGGRLAPWFLKDGGERPTVRSYFFEPMADVNMTQMRVATLLIASAIMLFALLMTAIAVKFGGVPVL
jgi:hypothetical protein